MLPHSLTDVASGAGLDLHPAVNRAFGLKKRVTQVAIKRKSIQVPALAALNTIMGDRLHL